MTFRAWLAAAKLTFLAGLGATGGAPDRYRWFILDPHNHIMRLYTAGCWSILTMAANAGIQGTPASFLPLDSIQEFNTQESPTADYGVKPGVVMNIGIKSGTNDLHGSAYYFHRNAAFDARNYFNPAPQPVSSLLMHEFGASLGGPILKDKWFYFFNYEGIRDKIGNPGLTDSPVTVSLASKLGGFRTLTAALIPRFIVFPTPSSTSTRRTPTIRTIWHIAKQISIHLRPVP